MISGEWLLERTPNQPMPVTVVQAIMTPGLTGLPVRILNPTNQAVVLHRDKKLPRWKFTQSEQEDLYMYFCILLTEYPNIFADSNRPGEK